MNGLQTQELCLAVDQAVCFKQSPFLKLSEIASPPTHPQQTVLKSVFSAAIYYFKKNTHKCAWYPGKNLESSPYIINQTCRVPYGYQLASQEDGISVSDEAPASKTYP